MTTEITTIALDLLAEWVAIPVGTEVIVTRDDGREQRARIRALPCCVAGHAVGWFTGIAGCYLLSRVRLAERAP